MADQKRILIVINSLEIGGAETLLVKAIPLFIKKGLYVDLLLIKKTDSPLYKQLIGLQNFSVYHLSVKGSVYNPFLLFKIANWLSKYNKVHVHLFPSLYWVALAKRISRPKVELYFTEHGTNNRRMKHPFYQLVDRMIYTSYKEVIAVSEDVHYAIQKHLSLNSIGFRLIHNGIPINEINGARPYSKTDFFYEGDQPSTLIIQVSSFQHPKDHPTLLRALKLLPENFKLLLVGTGVLLEKMQALAGNLGLADRVLFLGARMDVPRLLKTADIVVLSSKNEGLSLASIEGMASGRPFIGADVPGLTNIVRGAGLLFPAGNAHALARHVLDLMSDQSYYSRIVSACTTRASTYDIQTMVNKYYDIWFGTE